MYSHTQPLYTEAIVAGDWPSSMFARGIRGWSTLLVSAPGTSSVVYFYGLFKNKRRASWLDEMAAELQHDCCTIWRRGFIIVFPGVFIPVLC